MLLEHSLTTKLNGFIAHYKLEFVPPIKKCLNDYLNFWIYKNQTNELAETIKSHHS